jgi:hypothetical protein
VFVERMEGVWEGEAMDLWSEEAAEGVWGGLKMLELFAPAERWSFGGAAVEVVSRMKDPGIWGKYVEVMARKVSDGRR